MKLNIAFLPGNGIGPEVTAQSIKILKAIALEFNHDFIFNKITTSSDTQHALFDKAVELCKSSDAVLLGNINSKMSNNALPENIYESPIFLKLKESLGIYANIKPIKTYNKLISKSPIKKEHTNNTDVCIYQDLTANISLKNKTTNLAQGIALDYYEYASENIERIAHLAFKTAQSRNKKLTLIDKADMLSTSTLWRKTVQKIALEYSDVTFDFLLIENAVAKIISDPKQFDVILTETLFGNIISNLMNVSSATSNILASAFIGTRGNMFLPMQSTTEETSEKNSANPIASILSAAMLLEHFELFDEAELIKEAVETALKLEITTPDINTTYNTVSTDRVGDFISNFISNFNNSDINFNNISLGQSTII